MSSSLNIQITGVYSTSHIAHIVKLTARNSHHNKTPESSREKKEESRTPKRSRRQEIIKIRDESNQLETKKTIQRINQTKC